jgi:hypothetical protein
MNPDDVSTVQRSWAELRRSRQPLLDELTRGFADFEPSAMSPDSRAVWLLAAVEELVGLLPAPSRLAAHARLLGETWPDPLTAPCYGVEGRVWMAAAGACSANWSAATEAAWCQAWWLLSDVLAAETLSPFCNDDRRHDDGSQTAEVSHEAPSRVT